MSASTVTRQVPDGSQFRCWFCNRRWLRKGTDDAGPPCDEESFCARFTGESCEVERRFWGRRWPEVAR